MRNTILVGIGIILIALGVYYVVRSHSSPVQTETGDTKTGHEPLTFYCADQKTIQATFLNGSVALTLSDGRSFTLPQTLSGSGIRYEATTTGTDIAFVGKGDNTFLTEGDTTTYASCTAAVVAASDAPGYETYTDVHKTFTFAFPTDMEVAGSDIGYAPGWSSPEPTLGLVLAKIVVPQQYAPGTNFGDATFTVGTSADPAAVANCTTGPSTKAGAGTPVTIGEASFTKRVFNDAGAGNRYDTTSYRIVHGNQCYAIEYTIHYSVIENYPKGTVAAFDETKLADTLDEVAYSFRFLP